ncbi:MAG: response regulator [Planctomycetota bacterium]|nr:response regulator [Planctomycetota bacterium]
MTRVLLVDDDKTQCMSLGLACTSKGHTVEMATVGSRALGIGARFRPDVLVTDWMLTGPVDGIVISEALRAVNETTQTILITAYSSPDLRQTALRAKIFGYFEKPLNLEKVLAAVDKASQREPLPVNHRVGLIEADPEGRILHANSRARELVPLPEDISAADTLAQYLSYRSLVAVDSEDGWCRLSLVDGKASFFGYVKDRDAESRLLLLVGPDEAELQHHPVVRALVEAQGASKENRPSRGRILLVDDDELQRRLAVAQLKSLGRPFHSAESFTRAVHILEGDPDVDVILLDYESSDGDVADAVRRIRDISPGVTIVGTSAGFRKREFEELGVDKFLVKPVLAAAVSAVLDA